MPEVWHMAAGQGSKAPVKSQSFTRVQVVDTGAAPKSPTTKERIHVGAFSKNQVYIWKYQNHRENQRNQHNKRGTE